MGKPIKKTKSIPSRAGTTTPGKLPTSLSTKKASGKGGVTKVSKKLKRENKRSGLLNKLTASHEAKEKVRKAKIRSQKAIVGDMDPLLSALEDIQVLTKSPGSGGANTTQATAKKGKKKSAREKKRIASDLNDISLFKKVVEHEKFVQSPVTAIQDHVKYMMSMDST